MTTNDCSNCIPSEKCEALERRMDRVEDMVTNLRNDVARSEEKFIALKDSLDRIERVIQGLADEVKQITLRPAKSWDRLTTTILVAIITSIVTYVGTVVFGK